ncbi:TetR/AcrR family transcriptional regulator [Streptomyces longwoodensis]|jgi:AcrR family transcriptional regulator|uniref:TetR/AcrR family transcriptional regulator n=1 Tax=Streptomyces lasalocidi TaxID=324833 RepID=A0A4U5WPQ4_STRLS|nr:MULTISPECIES: TetR/AcrR family transcriptional regulator [Streptomyces]MCX4997399.1 TetR/AcrR family transcriptional regulator [Streptomyces longwoodensis]TKT04238.1 TetR/AcrR family transcriptional regulator [Streptomyces lasalocidi]WRY92027.1 TetR/AcrR family transcriptional regulator [Streptomyces longwoodensis]WTI43693.1 TetR/AcrR family transcriptional regulator [Streptomyces longwoodensis]WUC56452.1 TetR/AcrR family transcriptional regulator [Streptomyces longwoodensis]
MTANHGERVRRRLSTGERREQLLGVGARLFSESPYDDVWIEQVAEIAGVSRGLLYHYFPTKRDFFAAVVERESERMLAMTAPAPGVPVRAQLAAGLDAYLEYVRAHAHGYRAFHRADAAGDRTVRRVYQRALAAQERQVLAALAADPEFGPAVEGRPEVRLAVRGWLAFTTAVSLEWLRGGDLAREQVRDLCARALLGVLA